MSEGIRDLSERATPGEWHVGKHFEYEGFFLTDQVSNLGDDMDADDLAFIVALVNAYRSGQLHDDTALAEAEARGRRQGLEEAAKMARERGLGPWGCTAIRSLATAPAETQKPETGESDNLRIAMRMFMDSGHGGAMHTVREWFAAGGIGPVPDPGGACFWAWAKDNGLANVGGFVAPAGRSALAALERGEQP